jgi:hypothetical protein
LGGKNCFLWENGGNNEKFLYLPIMPQLLFNIAGPCHPSRHYMLNPLRNTGKELMDLIEQEQYFVIHAARQSGKTTLLWELTDKIRIRGFSG